MSVSDPQTVRSRWPLYVMPVICVVLAAGWSGFWFYAASKVGGIMDEWRAREAAAGRVFDCGERNVAGFPFRFEIKCKAVNVSLVAQTAGSTAGAELVNARLGEILVVAQVWEPQKILAEFKSPATLTDRYGSVMTVNWDLGRASAYGLPQTPERMSLEFTNPTVEAVTASGKLPVFKAQTAQLHGRRAPASTPENVVLETAISLTGGNVQGSHPILAQAFNANVRLLISGLKDFAPKPWPQRFRELQAAGGKLEVTQSRVEQGEVLSLATGTLTLSPSGNLNGELQMTIAGIEKVIPLLGLEEVLQQGVSQETVDRYVPGVKANDVNNLLGALDRAIPGLSRIVRQNANAGVAAGINALGTETTLEGKKARAIPLRFVEGTVHLGPIRVAQVPPLF